MNEIITVTLAEEERLLLSKIVLFYAVHQASEDAAPVVGRVVNKLQASEGGHEVVLGFPQDESAVLLEACTLEQEMSALVEDLFGVSYPDRRATYRSIVRKFSQAELAAGWVPPSEGAPGDSQGTAS
jgi:hypothetical protein